MRIDTHRLLFWDYDLLIKLIGNHRITIERRHIQNLVLLIIAQIGRIHFTLNIQ